MNSQLPSIDFSAYHSAIVRIATLREPGWSEPPHLLFASVELITPSRPVPDSMRVDAKGVPQVQRAGSIGIDLAFRRVSMRSEEAVTWYRSLKSAPSLPIPAVDVDRGRHDGTAIQASSFSDEPAWPFLSTPLADPSLFGSGEAQLAGRFSKIHAVAEAAIKKSGIITKEGRISCFLPPGGIQDNTINRLLLMSSSERHLSSVPIAFFIEDCGVSE